MGMVDVFALTFRGRFRYSEQKAGLTCLTPLISQPKPHAHSWENVPAATRSACHWITHLPGWL